MRNIFNEYFEFSAFFAIIGVATILQQITFAFPAALLLYHRRSASMLPANRSFKVPEPIGWIVNIVTVLFAFVSTIFYAFPYTSNPSAATMSKWLCLFYYPQLIVPLRANDLLTLSCRLCLRCGRRCDRYFLDKLDLLCSEALQRTKFNRVSYRLK